MLELEIIGELFDDSKNEFITIGPKNIRFEHSLSSISNWESNWKKPFLVKDAKTSLEMLDYIKCMAIDPITDFESKIVFAEYGETIRNYIESSLTATTISHRDGKGGGSSITTSEIIYYWMFSNGIPADPCEHWHLSRLLTLIEVFSIKNSPRKKMSRNDVVNMYRSLNAARREKLGTSG